jgi:hypothetical protein
VAKLGNAILSSEQIEEALARYLAGGVHIIELAAEYGVSQYTISSRLRLLAWRTDRLDALNLMAYRNTHAWKRVALLESL